MDTRREWQNDLLKIVSPVLDALSEGKLKETLPRSFHADRAAFAPLEAFGRSMLGLAPWLEADESLLDEDERALQRVWREKALMCIDRATDPASPDYMVFDRGGQPLVDTAFLAHAVLRAPHALASALDGRVKNQLANAFRASRAIASFDTNWLFFTAMVEAGLFALGEEYDRMRLLTALRCFQNWYAGDGTYGDGPLFHWDYYNSFVIQPMYVDIVNRMAGEHGEIEAMREKVNRRAARYASVLERMIGPDGSYPILGRSICYRFGAFQMLAQAALEHSLEAHLAPAGVRCGLTAVIRKVMSAPDMFDERGFLLPGVYGCQPELAEGYINIGSLYLCSAVFLPLGLPPKDPFWADEDRDWTGKTVWQGGHTVIDHAED
jgi:hypothetical protein